MPRQITKIAVIIDLVKAFIDFYNLVQNSYKVFNLISRRMFVAIQCCRHMMFQ